ncbi:hypothetical protein QN219_28455 [Sinorhizobium sp. 7-81]|nr:hypothetical protein [Sinorhizobium sp. 8-89]MDK1493922.1 hypothetical protein [Sinorhizobium sp. 8-89]
MVVDPAQVARFPRPKAIGRAIAVDEARLLHIHRHVTLFGTAGSGSA